MIDMIVYFMSKRYNDIVILCVKDKTDAVFFMCKRYK